ncbi:MAG: hypothetical protein HY923_07395 [Elusimicrobia bacterium]|nr:hypothetical protein [Elusimicrobiota bacterium]
MRNLILAIALLLPSLAFAGPKKPELLEDIERILGTTARPQASEGAALTPGAAAFITNTADGAVEVFCLTVTADRSPVLSYLKGVNAIHETAGPEILAILSRRQAKFLSRFPGVSLMSIPAIDEKVGGPISFR